MNLVLTKFTGYILHSCSGTDGQGTITLGINLRDHHFLSCAEREIWKCDSAGTFFPIDCSLPFCRTILVILLMRRFTLIHKPQRLFMHMFLASISFCHIRLKNACLPPTHTPVNLDILQDNRRWIQCNTPK
jgi:hypothetical protein